MSTIFERIIAGEIPSKKIYEDEVVMAFLSIDPIQKGHTLLIPKKVYRRMEESDDEILTHAFLTAKKIMKHMKTTLGCDYVKVMVEGVEVPHFHIHLIPSMLDVKNGENYHTAYSDNEADDYQQKLTMPI